MATGTIKFFNDAKGFGFITPSDGSKNIFAHSNDMKEAVRKGTNVSYTIEKGPREFKAVDISIVCIYSEPKI